MLASAIEAEVEEFFNARQHLRDEHGWRPVICNGFLPECPGPGLVECAVARK